MLVLLQQATSVFGVATVILSIMMMLYFAHFPHPISSAFAWILFAEAIMGSVVTIFSLSGSHGSDLIQLSPYIEVALQWFAFFVSLVTSTHLIRVLHRL